MVEFNWLDESDSTAHLITSYHGLPFDPKPSSLKGQSSSEERFNFVTKVT